MGLIFRINGNFADKKKAWCTPDPYYEGSIVIAPNDIVYGIAKILTGNDDDEKEKLSQLRCLYGRIVTRRKDEECLLLMMLSPTTPKDAILITIFDINYEEMGQWAPIEVDEKGRAFDCWGNGYARMHFDYVGYSPMEIKRIKSTYQYYLSRSRDDYNYQLIGTMENMKELFMETFKI